MGGAVFHRSRAYEPATRSPRTASRPLPKGYGLLIGAGVSLTIWAGLAFSVVKLFA